MSPTSGCGVSADAGAPAGDGSAAKERPGLSQLWRESWALTSPHAALAVGHHVEADDDGLLFDDLKYSCGCREIRHIYHDGSTRIRTIRHDGKVLMDEHSGEHETFEA